uniref:ephrin-A1-like n=1 Tax=Ciona intestinalis TaxID=7719 RepID=UPI000180BE84|nr:ephrin-A1-like [Ciona intestinalis]|eukprot:XP_002121867.1 ephrin-A1-like [Ciona intestinalis]
MVLSKVNRMILSLFICYLLFNVVQSKQFNSGSGTINHDVMWDPRQNVGFTPGNEYSIEVHMRDYMNIHCPMYDADNEAKLSFIIYNVSEQSYNSCLIGESEKVILKCNNPFHSRKLTFRFQRQKTLNVVFQPNQDYYFMAFKKGVVETCETAMKMTIHVLPKNKSK